jgi:hypothetical protein
LTKFGLLNYSQCGLSESWTLTSGDYGGWLTGREKPSASGEDYFNFLLRERPSGVMKWPSYQERNLEARVTLAEIKRGVRMKSGNTQSVEWAKYAEARDCRRYHRNR